MSAPDVRAFTVGPVQENCYIVRAGAEQTRAVIVDPGDEPERLLAAIDALGVEIEAILLTHCHFDHIGAVAPVARATGAPVYCPQIERPLLADIMSWVPPGFGPFESYEAEHLRQRRRAPEPRRPRARRAVHTRAQPRPLDIRGPIARPPRAAVRRRAVPGLGRSRRSTGRGLADARALDRGRCCAAYPDETAVYPGHMGVTTLGRERAANPFLSELRERVPVARTADAPAT